MGRCTYGGAKMNIIIGMCGMGNRFQEKGFKLPKYLISYNGAPMIYHSVATLKIPGKIHFIVKSEHLNKYSFLEKLLLSIGDVIIPCTQDTGGAAETLLLSKNYINPDESLLSINCDQFMNWNPQPFLSELKREPGTCFIPTFKETSNKCSYVREDSNNLIVEVKEKVPISDNATVGIYHWSKAKDFFVDAEKMIQDNQKQNGEYYVAPVYNNTIARGIPVRKFEIQKNEFWPVGTPQDMMDFLNTNKNFD